MSTFKAKRPSSARRSITQETFSPSVSLTRLRNIQAQLDLPDDGEGKQTKPDSILCVLGIDGRYNDGTRELVNYLLFSFFDVRKIELERFVKINGFAEEVIDDEEFAEEFKIKSFISMVEGSRMIGVPYCSSGQKMEFDKMSIEKWPIIQAYAIEGVGGFEDTMTLTEGLVCEPLSTYFSHGRVVTAKGGRSLPIRHPFVLFGTHTSRHHLEDAHRAGISFNSDPDSTGLHDEPAHHMVSRDGYCSG
ncbi:hypothetical protein LSH36_75g04034 [Paralvinella palmiformis]|uniref:Uncharacterized protein n=1 Tax=Paralvinella palmiformis TaxID=53620 RepID=A0AAD9NB84_9ANNE|nr:hypothetical protein LSH36_75g04034 [Paralvinella palmiformis]